MTKLNNKKKNEKYNKEEVNKRIKKADSERETSTQK